MQVFDLTRLRNVDNPPIEFEPDAWLGDMGAAHNIVINEESGFAYAVGADTFSGGPSFIDINDPLNPVTVGGYDGASTGYTHQGWLDEEHTLIYLGDETDEGNFEFNTRTVILDVSDLDNPFLLEEHFGETSATDHNMYVRGDKIYQSNYSSGMRVLQINDDPENRLEEIGYFDVFPEHNENGYQGTWSLYPYFPSGNVAISSRDEGLFVVISSVEGSCYVVVDELGIDLFSVFPNPVKDELTIQMKEGEILEELSITDITGRQVYIQTEINTSLTNYPLNVSTLAPGAYFISINNAGKSQRFIVE